MDNNKSIQIAFQYSKKNSNLSIALLIITVLTAQDHKNIPFHHNYKPPIAVNLTFTEQHIQHPHVLL